MQSGEGGMGRSGCLDITVACFRQDVVE